MRCEFCNAEIKHEQAAFCPNCGRRLTKPDAAGAPAAGEAAAELPAPEKAPKAPKKKRTRRSSPPRSAAAADAPEAQTPAAPKPQPVPKETPAAGEAAAELPAPEKAPEAPKKKRTRRSSPPRSAAAADAPEAQTPAAPKPQPVPEETPTAPKPQPVPEETPAAGEAAAHEEKAALPRRDFPAPHGNASAASSRPARARANALTILLAAVVLLVLIGGLAALVLPGLPQGAWPSASSSAPAEPPRDAALSFPTPEPSAQEPVVSAPATSEPSAQEPVVPAPATSEPSAQEPVAPAPAASEPSVQEPVVPAPAASEPSVQEPVVQEPDVQEPVIQEPDVQEPSAPADPSEYVFPQSSSQYLTDADLAGLDKATLRLARNEICARHGKMFRDAELRAYFESRSWYSGTVEADAFDRLVGIYNEYEVANIALIQRYEAM